METLILCDIHVPPPLLPRCRYYPAVDYNRVMAHRLSVRFKRADLLDRLKAEASTRKVSCPALAEELIEEGLRMRRHTGVVFRDGATARRAALAGGPDIWEVIGGLVGGGVPVDNEIRTAVESPASTAR